MLFGLWWIGVWDGAYIDRLVFLGRGVCCGYGLSFGTSFPFAFAFILLRGLDGCLSSRFGFLNWGWSTLSPPL